MSPPGSAGWRRREVDKLLAFGRSAALPRGGFGWLGADGAVDVGQPCPLYINSRMTYVFALAHLAGVPGAEPLAAAGIQALLDRYADTASGGWFASVDVSGRVTDTTKSNYAHTTALLASCSAVTAGIGAAETALAVTTAAIDQHFWSDAEGCARESWDAAFTESEPYRGANSNMHSVEAYLVASDVTGDRVWRERAAAIAGRLIGEQARAHAWRVPEHYDERWRPRPDYNSDRRHDQFRPYGTTPGHSFEWTRLLLALEASMASAGPQPPSWLLDAATALFGTAVADAWHRDGHPGPIYTVDENGQPVVSVRLHWVACEAVLAADALYRRTGDGRYARAAATWWDEIDRYFIDRQHGGWWHELTPELVPSFTTVSGKPDLYHAYQALVFPSLPPSPAAAVALAGHRP